MRILCQVVSVQPLGLVVSLPDQLLGHIPVTQISSQISSLLEMADLNAENSDDDSTVNEGKLPDLSLMFHPGQFLRAVVTGVKPAGISEPTVGSSSRDPVEKASRRVELSLVPEQVNGNVSKADIQPGFVRLPYFC